MYIQALATDYDGTIAEDGTVAEATIAALEALKKTGRKLILVTGRELPDLKRVFGELSLFDRMVVENGALLYNPATEEERIIAPEPSAELVRLLDDRGVGPISVGRTIIATWEPHQAAVLEAIHELGLELQIIFNKGAVMILPAGVNKATGLAEALTELKLSAHNVVGVGDAENDHAFLRCCGFGAAVANALPMLKEAADLTLEGARGAGVIELIEKIAAQDGYMLAPARHGLGIGKNRAGEVMTIEPYRGSILIAGSSGIGKSTLATAMTERMAEREFQFCIFDPEGDYMELENAVPVGDPKNPPQRSEVERLLEQGVSVVVNTQAIGLEERPEFFAKLMPHVSKLRIDSGRPHWLLIDEAHHLLPVSRHGAAAFLPQELPAAILITVHPEAVATEALKAVSHVIALGKSGEAFKVIAGFCAVNGAPLPDDPGDQSDDEVLFWAANGAGPVHVLKPERPRQSHKRHTRKYAQGDLGPERSFFFKGPENRLNLRAQNLMMFLQITEGLDDETWQHHLRAGDYSNWFRVFIKDDELAREAEAVERDATLDANESRKQISDLVTKRYTAPAGPHT